MLLTWPFYESLKTFFVFPHKFYALETNLNMFSLSVAHLIRDHMKQTRSFFCHKFAVKIKFSQVFIHCRFRICKGYCRKLRSCLSFPILFQFWCIVPRPRPLLIFMWMGCLALTSWCDLKNKLNELHFFSAWTQCW